MDMSLYCLGDVRQNGVNVTTSSVSWERVHICALVGSLLQT